MCVTIPKTEKDNTIKLCIETLMPNEYKRAIRSVEIECGPGKLFPDGVALLEVTSLWPFAVYADGVYGGFIFLEFTVDDTAILHVGKMPWFPSSLARQALERVLEHAFQWVDTVEAYIPPNRRSLARLARMAGFRIEKTEDHYHGQLTLRNQTGTPATGDTTGEDGRREQ